MIALLGAGVGKHNEKITKLAALTLNNISMAPASRKYLSPFETDIFTVAATDETVTKLLSNILAEMNQWENEDNISKWKW